MHFFCLKDVSHYWINGNLLTVASMPLLVDLSFVTIVVLVSSSAADVASDGFFLIFLLPLTGFLKTQTLATTIC